MRLSDTVLVGFERGPEPVDGQAEIFTAALQRIRAMPGVAAATPIRAVPFSGFHVPPIGVPGMADSPNVGGQLPHSDCCDSRVSRHPRHRGRARPGLHRRRRVQRRCSRRHRQRNHGPGRVAWSKRDRQMRPAGIRSVLQSDDRRWSARTADHGAVPRGRRRRTRRASTLGRARWTRRSAHAVLRALLTGPWPTGGHPCRARHSGPARPDGGAGRDSRRVDSSRCRRWSNRSSVCRSAAVLRSAGATDAAVAPRDDAAGDLCGTGGHRRRHGFVRRLRSCHIGAPA